MIIIPVQNLKEEEESLIDNYYNKKSLLIDYAVEYYCTIIIIQII